MTVAIVTDSGSDLPADLARNAGIAVVPLSIRFGEEELVDGVDLTPGEFWARCAKSPELPKTAAPSPGAFRDAYARAFAGGAEAVVCVTLSAALSATIEAARAGAAQLAGEAGGGAGAGGGPVRVIDSRSISLGEGLMALEGARLAGLGKGIEDVAGALGEMVERTRFYGAMNTLEYLRRGGRIGPAAAAFGSLLSVKPVITLENGLVEAESRQRTRPRSLRHLVDKLAASAPLDQVGIVHGDAPDLDEFLRMVYQVVPERSVIVGDLGPVVGTHSGPGSIGITFQVQPAHGA